MKKILIILLCLFSLSLNARIRYLSPRGNNANAGTDSSSTGAWATWSYAASQAVAGDTVYAMKGTFYPTGTSAIATFTHSGTYSNRICFFNYPNQSPIIDGHLRFNQDWNTGFNLTNVYYIKFRGIEIKNLLQPRIGNEQAVAMGGNDIGNIEFENMKIHDIGGSGCRFFGSWKYPSGGFNYETEGYNISAWDQALIDHGYAFPEQSTMGGDTTRFINCDFYNLCDSSSHAVGSGGSADGLKFDNEVGSYLEITGCRSWHCSDDGFDISGSVKVVFRNTWSIGNGRMAGGDGSGAKVAYPRTNIGSPIRLFYNCIFVNNRSAGIPSIVDGGYPCQSIYVANCLFYNNDVGIYDAYGGNACLIDEPRTYYNNVVYASKQIYAYDAYAFRTGSTHSHNSWDAAVTINDADFVSLDSTQLWGTRQSNYSLPVVTFGRLTGGSDLIGAGTNVSMSATPDMGVDWTFYDLGGGSPPITNTPTIYSNTVIAKSIQATAGGNVTSDGGATITERGIVWGTSANPTTSNNKIVVSGTTGSYSATITGLSGNTTYYARAYAINSVGTSYGADVSFITSIYTPVLTNGKVLISNGKVVIIK